MSDSRVAYNAVKLILRYDERTCVRFIVAGCCTLMVKKLIRWESESVRTDSSLQGEEKSGITDRCGSRFSVQPIAVDGRTCGTAHTQPASFVDHQTSKSIRRHVCGSTAADRPAVRCVGPHLLNFHPDSAVRSTNWRVPDDSARHGSEPFAACVVTCRCLSLMDLSHLK